MDGRPNPDALLQQIQRETETEQPGAAGRLKIFFGYAAGVGKTYAMLEAAHAAKKNGIDVVNGYIEPHTRPETMALIDGLEQLPVRTIDHKGVTLRDFDLDAALVRAPELILVDELAHTNAEGARHEKRYQDIKELLHHGIDVYTTVNVQHIESLNDLVASITGVIVRERVPDKVFDEAYQVELVDIEPEELIARLQTGKIYRSQQAHRALDNFFSMENLTALREIALRRTADRVNRSAPKTVGKAAVPIAEHMMICLSPSPTNPKVIRTAARMRDAFHGRFTALYVAPPELLPKDGEEARRLKENMRLAESLGAHTVTVYGNDVPVQIAEYAKVSGVTKIILGRTNTRRAWLSSRKNLVEILSELVPELDVYIIPDTVKAERCRPSRKKVARDEPISLRSGVIALAIFAASTGLSIICAHMGFNEACVVTLYVFGLLVTAVMTGSRLLGLVMAIASVLTYNFFFTIPYYTLAVYDPGYMLALVVMFLVSIVAGSLSRRVRRQSRQEAMKAYRMEVLFQTSQKLQLAESEDALLSQVAAQLVNLLGRSVTIYPADQSLGEPLFVPAPNDIRDPSYYLTPDEFAVAAWAFENRKHAGATTGTLPGARNLYLAVRGQNAVYAVVGISMADAAPLDSFEKNLLLALMDLISLSMERLRLSRTKRQTPSKSASTKLFQP